jgi:hypothetical protein
MLKGFAPIVARWRKELSIETGIGVGLHFGDVARCLHGPPGQRAHTLVGDTVNVAARLCSRARAGEVLFSAAVGGAASRPRGRRACEPLKPCIRLPQFSHCAAEPGRSTFGACRRPSASRCSARRAASAARPAGTANLAARLFPFAIVPGYTCALCPGGEIGRRNGLDSI